MSLFTMPRVPEPEVMDADNEVEAYASAAAQNYLFKIDQTFVGHVACLLPPPAAGQRALDIGCGPGQIVLMMAKRWPQLTFTGIDAAPHMVEEARKNAAADAVSNVSFEVLRVAKDSAESRLPHPDASFDIVTCNSVLHHLADPLAALNEIARVAKPGGAVLLRDLRRPGYLLFPIHVKWFGRKYSGEMRRLYEASVRAAYTFSELESMLSRSRLNDGRSRVFRHGITHIGIERAAL